MKINVVKDEKGKVVATFENAAAGGPSLMPVLQPGYKVQEVEVAENYRTDLKTVYAR